MPFFYAETQKKLKWDFFLSWDLLHTFLIVEEAFVLEQIYGNNFLKTFII